MISVFFSLPINNFPTRKFILDYFDKTERDFNAFTSITVLLAFTTMMFAILFSNMKLTMAFIGGLFGTIISFTIPGLIYIKLNSYKNKTINFLISSLVLLLTIIGISGAIYILIV